MLTFIKLHIEQARGCVCMGSINSYSFSQYDD